MSPELSAPNASLPGAAENTSQRPELAESAAEPALLTKSRPALSVMAVPLAGELITAPLLRVRSAAAPLASKVTAPEDASDPVVSDCALVNAKGPTVPETASALIMLLPVSATVPAPLSAKVAAVTAPAPLSVAPEATAVVAVPEPTLSEPDSVSMPALTVVVPV